MVYSTNEFNQQLKQVIPGLLQELSSWTKRELYVANLSRLRMPQRGYVLMSADLMRKEVDSTTQHELLGTVQITFYEPPGKTAQVNRVEYFGRVPQRGESDLEPISVVRLAA